MSASTSSSSLNKYKNVSIQEDKKTKYDDLFAILGDSSKQDNKNFEQEDTDEENDDKTNNVNDDDDDNSDNEVKLNINGEDKEKEEDEVKLENTTRKRKGKPFNEDILTNKDGLQRVYEEFFDAVPFRGTGFEAQDIKKLMTVYKEWAFQLYPGLPCTDIYDKCQLLGSKGTTRSCIDDLRDRERTRYLRDVMNIPINDIGGQGQSMRTSSSVNDEDDLTSPEAPSPDVNNSNKNNDSANNDSIDDDEEAENWMIESQLASNNREHQRRRIIEEEEEEAYFDEKYENTITQSSYSNSITISQDPFNNDDLFDGCDDEFEKIMAEAENRSNNANNDTTKIIVGIETEKILEIEEHHEEELTFDEVNKEALDNSNTDSIDDNVINFSDDNDE